MRPIIKAILVGLAVFAVIGLILVGVAYQEVPEGHEGVLKEWDAVTGETYEPGANWIVPIAESVEFVEIRPRTFNGTVDVTTLNGTTFDVEYVIRYRVSEEQAAGFVQQWSDVEQVERRMIEPSVEDRLRRQGADIESSIIFQKAGRDRLSSAAIEILENEFSDEALVLESVQIVNVEIPQEYQEALNEKEIAKQQIQQEQYNVDAEEQRARQKIVQAQADANATRIRAAAYRENPIILKAEYIEAIDGNGTVFVLPQNGTSPIILDSNNNNGR